MTRSSAVDRIAHRGWRAYADARRRFTGAGTAVSALDALGARDRDDLERWLEATAAGHERYRELHPPASSEATIVCVSRRPALLGQVAENVARQQGVDIELIFVANDPGFADIDIESELAPVARSTVLGRGGRRSLGAALNQAIAAASARFVAKFDDDDWYGPGYLVDGLRAHGYAGAAVVGKHSYYAHLAGTDGRHLRFPGREFSYSSTLAGGTLLIDRERTTGLEFDDVSLGEDRRFIAACHRHGRSTFAADRFNFVQHRGTDNTWQLPDAQFLAGCVEVDPHDDVHRVER